ncbi:MAG TPA: hypothetical protein V6D48_13880 [Oculatellaceae cyanobacterium]
MSSESEDTPEPSLKGTSEIRLHALEPKGNGLGADKSVGVSSTPNNPGGQYRL